MHAAPAADVIDAQGLRLRLWDHGGGGPVVLAIHGALDTGRSFDAVAHALADAAPNSATRPRLLALDLRGHGASERAGAGSSAHLLDHMKDVACVLDGLARRDTPVAAVLGHSMGGNIALLVAGAAPALVKSLVLLDSCGPPAEAPEDQPERLGDVLASVLHDKRPFSSVRSIDDAVARVCANNPGLSAIAARRMVEHVLVPQADGSFAFPFDPRLRGPSPVRYPEGMWLSLCARVQGPVTLVRASEGYVADDDVLRARVAALRAEVLTVPGPHHLHVEDPTRVAAVVRHHLTR